MEKTLVLINNGTLNSYNLQQGPWRKTLLLSNYFSKMIHRIKIPITATWAVLDCNQEKKMTPPTHQWKQYIPWKKSSNFQSF